MGATSEDDDDEVVFLGVEALAAGRVTRHGLAAHHRRVLPGVFAPKAKAKAGGGRLSLDLEDRITAAWLWSGRRGIVCGAAAAAMHGARWVADDVPIEMNLPHQRSAPGIVTRRDTLLDGEVGRLRGIAVTTPARTAFDLARQGPVGRAVERLDALARATALQMGDVLAVRDAHRRVRGRRRVAAVLNLVDPGAQSPKETWLRLLLVTAGFPRPRTQIPVPAPDGYPRYYLDMGWEDLKVAVEYDGEQHRLDPAQYRGDVLRAEYIDSLGWRRIRVLAGHRRDDIIARVARAGVPRKR